MYYNIVFIVFTKNTIIFFDKYGIFIWQFYANFI
jgi:hypothetical protein